MRGGNRIWGLLIAVVAMLAALGATQVASAKKTKHRYPPGTVKLASSKIKCVKGVVCAKTGTQWASGTLVGPRRFLSDSRQQQNYRGLARKAKGRAKKKDLKRASLRAAG